MWDIQSYLYIHYFGTISWIQSYVVYYIIKIQISIYFCGRDYYINTECQSPTEDITNDVRKCDDQIPDSHLQMKGISNVVQIFCHISLNNIAESNEVLKVSPYFKFEFFCFDFY